MRSIHIFSTFESDGIAYARLVCPRELIRIAEMHREKTANNSIKRFGFVSRMNFCLISANGLTVYFRIKKIHSLTILFLKRCKSRFYIK